MLLPHFIRIVPNFTNHGISRRLQHRFDGSQSLDFRDATGSTVLGITILVLFLSLVLSGCSLGKTSINSGNPLSNLISSEELSRGSTGVVWDEDLANAQHNYVMGELALKNHDFDAAIDYFNEALVHSSEDSVTLRTRLAQLNIKQGKLDVALTHVDAAIKSQPQNGLLKRMKAGILATTGELDAAISIYKNLIDEHISSSAISSNAKQDSNKSTIKLLNAGPPEEIVLLLGNLYSLNNQIDEAIHLLTNFHATQSSSPKNSGFMLHLIGKLYAQKKDFAKSLQYLDKALNDSSTSTAKREPILLDKARVHAVNKNTEAAKEVCREILKINPESQDAQKLLGQLLVKENKIDEAIEAFEHVDEMETTPGEARLHIALLKMQKQDFEDASLDLELIIGSNPTNYKAHYYLASSYAGLNKVDRAINQIKQIPIDSEVFLESRTFGAFLFQRDGRFAEAASLLREAAEKKPDDVRLLSLLVNLERQAKNNRGAIEVLEQMIELAPDNANFHFTLGALYDELDDKTESEMSMRRAIALNPKFADALNYLGYTLAERGENLDEAEELVVRALEEDPENGYYLDSLGWVYYQRGEYEKAKVKLEKAVKITDNDPVILEHLGLAYLKLGDDREAARIFRLALESALEDEDKLDDEELPERLEELISEIENR